MSPSDFIRPLAPRDFGPDAVRNLRNRARNILVRGIEANDFHEHALERKPDNLRLRMTLKPGGPQVHFDGHTDCPTVLEHVRARTH